MPAQAPALTDERELLLAYVAQQRDGLRNAAYGLTDVQARLAPTAGTLTIGGLLKHADHMERNWMGIVLQRDDGDETDYFDSFSVRPDERLADILDRYEATGRATDDAIRSIPDLGQAVPVPQGVPWFPDDVEAWSVRWVLLHLIEELGRHAGHADIVRESIDGATMYELQAAAEGWPATDWLQPWTPPNQPV